MGTDTYTLFGEVNVPAEQKEEMNKYVMELLDKCGIRLTKEIQLGGKQVTVLQQPKPDANGIVNFNYSIFEMKKRAFNTYDMNSCKLLTPDRGYSEFGVVMNMIMILQESYTNGTCYMMYYDKPMNSLRPYLVLLQTLLDKRFELHNRGRLMEMFLYFKDNNIDLTPDDLTKRLPWEFVDVDYSQVYALLGVKKPPEITSEPSETIDETLSITEIEKRKAAYGYASNLFKEISNAYKKTGYRLPFYKVILRKFEDEFIEFWNGQDINFSRELIIELFTWFRRYKDIAVPSDMQMESYLSEILEDLEKNWNCLLVNEKIVIEFMEHKESNAHKKALLLLKEILDNDLSYFPELTKQQANDWILKGYRNSFTHTAVKAYQSMLGNHKLRMEVFGF